MSALALCALDGLTLWSFAMLYGNSWQAWEANPIFASVPLWAGMFIRAVYMTVLTAYTRNMEKHPEHARALKIMLALVAAFFLVATVSNSLSIAAVITAR